MNLIKPKIQTVKTQYEANTLNKTKVKLAFAKQKELKL